MCRETSITMGRIIGHGTRYDKVAVEMLERERKLDRSLDFIRTEMGVGASGFPHIGSFADARGHTRWRWPSGSRDTGRS